MNLELGHGRDVFFCPVLDVFGDLFDSFSFESGCGNDRNPEMCGEFFGVNFHASFFELVIKIEDHGCGDARLEDLKDKVQAAFQGYAVYHTQNPVDGGNALSGSL